jgi:hypothetical protein
MSSFYTNNDIFSRAQKPYRFDGLVLRVKFFYGLVSLYVYHYTLVSINSSDFASLKLVLLSYQSYNSTFNLGKKVNITDYDSLLAVARQQTQPQRFLFVFLKKALPHDHKGDEESRYNSGVGGELTPVMTLNKPLNVLTNFEDLVSESRQQNRQWDMVLVAVLEGKNGIMPTDEQAVEQLEVMMKTVETGGNLAKYMTFDREGTPLLFKPSHV